MMSKAKRIITIYIILIIFTVTAFIGLIPKVVKANTLQSIPSGMEKICENNDLILFLDPNTTMFAVQNKTSGNIMFASPENLKDDGIANKRFKEIMSSNILVTYIDANGEKTISGYTNAVAFGQFEVERLDNGVSIEYLITETIVDELALPLVMPYSFLHEKLLPKLSKEEGNELLQNYNKISVKDDIIKNYVKRHRIKMYPFIVEEDIYIFIPARRSALNREIIKGFLEKAEITEEEIIALNEKYYDHTSIEKNPKFKIKLYITLEDNGIKAQVDMSEIEYDSFDAELKSITLLPYFGAAGSSANGYILIPDGSGALMRLNSEYAAYTPVILPVYGGYGFDIDTTKSILKQPVSLAAFGIAYDNKGFAAVICEGDAVSSIEAGLAGLNTAYNYVCAQFAYNDYYMLSNPMNLTKSPQTGKNPYKGKASVLYMFLDENTADYSKMALKVRSYYESTGVLSDKKTHAGSPVSLEIPCAVPVVKRFLGITYNSYEAVTSFSDVSNIIDRLNSTGIYDMNIKLTGWTDGGIIQKYPGNLSPNKAAGGNKEFNRLITKANELTISLFPDVSFTNIRSGIFTALLKGVFDLKGSPKAVYRFNHITQTADAGKFVSYLIKPSVWDDLIMNVQSKLKKFGLPGMSVYDFGYTVYSDNIKNGYNRQDSLIQATEALDLIKNTGMQLTGLYGNINNADKFDILSDVPLYSSKHVAAQESVPFLQMVLRGYTNYYGTPVNKNTDSLTHVLKSVEYGASGIKYLLTNADNTTVWELDQNLFRNTLYTDYIDEIGKYNSLISEYNKKTAGQKIIEHKKVDVNVYSTLYENGVKTYVNYNGFAVFVNGVYIDRLSFVIEEGLS